MTALMLWAVLTLMGTAGLGIPALRKLDQIRD